jgi:uncharacterized protein YqeY
MTAEQLHTRYVTEIDKRGRDDKYIDGVEERELMQIAIQHGFAPERARAFLTDVCQEKGYIIEAAVVRQIREKLQSHSQSGQHLEQSAFETIVRDAKQLVATTTRSDQEVRKLVVNTIDDCGLKCRKKWGLIDWYAKTKQQLGIA